MKAIAFGAISILVVPHLVLAQSGQTLGGILGVIQGLLDALIPFLITLAVIYFFWGVAKFILSAGNEDARKEGRDIMIYGIIALFVIVGVWGLVGVISTTFGIQTGGGTDIPRINN